MQKAFLVSTKVTQVREYWEHRSIIEVTEEHKSLHELDIAHLGIIDVDKFIYIYYGSDDGDLAFRGDLNIFRQLAQSAFFHADTALFILVDCTNPMLEDMIHSACKDSVFVGSRLEIIFHTGALKLSDASRYVTGFTVGSQTTSSYKAVYIQSAESEERERYVNSESGIDSVLPVLTDQYTMYKKRAEVEAVSSARDVSEHSVRPQILKNFNKQVQPTVRQWTSFVFSGELYTKFELGITYLLDYYQRVGLRCLLVDMTSSKSISISIESMHKFALSDVMMRTVFSEAVGYLHCRYNQLGYVLQMLDNVDGVSAFIFICDKEDYSDVVSYLSPLSTSLHQVYTTHYCETAVQDFLNSGLPVTTLFLSKATVYDYFKVASYREEFKGVRVAQLVLEDADTTDYFECAVGGGL